MAAGHLHVGARVRGEPQARPVRRVFGCYSVHESGVPLARDESRILLAALDAQPLRALREREQCEVVVQGRQTTWSGSREGLGMNA